MSCHQGWRLRRSTRLAQLQPQLNQHPQHPTDSNLSETLEKSTSTAIKSNQAKNQCSVQKLLDPFVILLHAPVDGKLSIEMPLVWDKSLFDQYKKHVEFCYCRGYTFDNRLLKANANQLLPKRQFQHVWGPPIPASNLNLLESKSARQVLSRKRKAKQSHQDSLTQSQPFTQFTGWVQPKCDVRQKVNIQDNDFFLHYLLNDCPCTPRQLRFLFRPYREHWCAWNLPDTQDTTKWTRDHFTLVHKFCYAILSLTGSANQAIRLVEEIMSIEIAANDYVDKHQPKVSTEFLFDVDWAMIHVFPFFLFRYTYEYVIGFPVDRLGIIRSLTYLRSAETKECRVKIHDSQYHAQVDGAETGLDLDPYLPGHIDIPIKQLNRFVFVCTERLQNPSAVRLQFVMAGIQKAASDGLQVFDNSIARFFQHPLFDFHVLPCIFQFYSARNSARNSART